MLASDRELFDKEKEDFNAAKESTLASLDSRRNGLDVFKKSLDDRDAELKKVKEALNIFAKDVGEKSKSADAKMLEVQSQLDN